MKRQSSFPEFGHLIDFDDCCLEDDWSWIGSLVGMEDIDSIFNNLSHGHLITVQYASNAFFFTRALCVHLRQTHSTQCTLVDLCITVEEGSICFDKLLEDWFIAEQLRRDITSFSCVLHYLFSKIINLIISLYLSSWGFGVLGFWFLGSAVIGLILDFYAL